MNIAIIGGNGLMGRMHRSIFEEQGHEVLITDTRSALTPVEAAQRADAVILAVPLAAVEQVIAEVAPHCKAILDMSSLKQDTLQSLLLHAPPNAEVGGLHPLYGFVKSLQGQTVVFCPTERSGVRCRAILDVLRAAGACIEVMDAAQHDRVCSLLQNLRVHVLAAYITTLQRAGIPAHVAHALAPPPTRILLDLAARQCNEHSDALYEELVRLNPHDAEDRALFMQAFQEHCSRGGAFGKELRAFFGEHAAEARVRSQELIEQEAALAPKALM